MTFNRRWIEPEPVPVPAEILDLVSGSPLLAQILWRRGMRSPEAARAFLDPDCYTPSPPSELPGLSATADRLEAAIRRGEQICVWGDFDVDGQTATSVLVSTLRDLGARVSYHIPVRGPESHGVSLPVLQQVIDAGARLVLTCDTGIAAHDAARLAAQHHVDFLITDHHELPPSLPEAAAIVSPRLLPAAHPLAALPGVGVAYKLAEELFNRAGCPEKAAALLDLAALGIVADVAALLGDTRWLLQRGLARLRASPRPALAAMLEFAGIDPLNITEDHIGFSLGPRLNALGRLSDANPVVEFFLSSDLPRVRVMAQHLEGLNAERRLQTSQVFKAALDAVEADPTLLQSPVLVLAHPAWPAGIIGIVASRLVDLYQKPVVLLTAPPGESARGSARSVPGVNITALIAAVHAAQPGLVLNFGGHPMAAGLSLSPGSLETFRRALWHEAARQLGEQPGFELQVDGELPLASAGLEFAEKLEQLAPFGPGNPSLVLVARDLRLVRRAVLGSESEHLALTIADDTGESRRVIWWNGAGRPLPEGRFHLAYTLRPTTFNGRREAQLQWVDFQPAGDAPVILESPSIRLQDFRGLEHPLPHLQSLLANSQAQLCCQGEAKSRLIAYGLQPLYPHEIGSCEHLVLWTTPPGRDDLSRLLRRASPSTITVFAVDPETAALDAFLKRLAGLVKYIISHESGQASLLALAGACAQTGVAVQFGLDWLQARGHIRWHVTSRSTILLEPGAGRVPEVLKEITPKLQQLLEESAAFRAWFKTAPQHDLEPLLTFRSGEKD